MMDGRRLDAATTTGPSVQLGRLNRLAAFLFGQVLGHRGK